MRKLLLCLQFCPIDQDQALYLARLIADNEPVKRFDVEFAISYRPDSSPAIVEEIEYILRQKFHYFRSHKSLRRGKGWPHGCNDLWFDTMNWAYTLKKSKQTNCNGIFTFEADNLPLQRDWINALCDEWEQNWTGKLAVGNLHAEPIKHINGNGMFLIAMQDKIGQVMHGCPAHEPWDLYLAKFIVPKSHDTNKLFQLYRKQVNDIYELAKVKKNGVRPAVLHGLKGEHHLALAKTFLTLTPSEIEEYEKGRPEDRELPELRETLTVAAPGSKKKKDQAKDEESPVADLEQEDGEELEEA